MARKRLPAPPQAIIFDIGGVILRLNLSRAFAPLANALQERRAKTASPADFAPDKVWARIRSDARWRDWQEGRMSAEEWHRHITGNLGVHIGFAEFCAAWNRALDPETMLPDELFARLGARFQLALLSNTDPLHVAGLERQFAFMRHFPVRIYSCSVGASKPHPAIYQAALEALGVAAAAALYVDDVPEFAAAARSLGMDAIHFEHPGQFAREMARRDLPAPPADPQGGTG